MRKECCIVIDDVIEYFLCSSAATFTWGDGIDYQYVQDGTKCGDGKVRILRIYSSRHNSNKEITYNLIAKFHSLE